jgi:hypothetical protein
MHNLEAVGGSGATDAIRVDDAIVEAQRRRLISMGHVSSSYSAGWN